MDYKKIIEQMIADGAISREAVEKYFPQLKESEDDRIRKEIISFVKGYIPDETSRQRKTYLAWLEKKGEQKPTNLAKGEDYGIDGLYNAIRILEKTLGKVEGYQTDDGILEHECAISAVKKLYEQKPAWGEEDDEMVQVAINACNSYQDSLVRSDSRFDKAVKAEDWLKSLKDRVQPKQEWSKEDEDNFKHLMDEIVCLGNSRNSAERLHYDRLIKFLDELKNRVQPREEWCDKDERMLDRLIAYFEKRVAFTDDDNPRYANWLKSLRPQNHWKPSDEQMEALDFAADCIVPDEFCNKKKYLKSLLTDLNKLRG